MSLLALALTVAVPARAADVAVRIDAIVEPDLHAVRGTIRVESDLSVALRDPLERLPGAPDDLNLFRTFPGAPSQGVVRWSNIDEDTWSFYAILPRRYGDIGATRRFGLFANGGWYPQPLVREEVPVVDWQVTVKGPAGSALVVGERAGHDAVTWTGAGERVSLAVVPRGRITPIEEEGLKIDVVTRGRPRRVLLKELRHQLEIVRERDKFWRGAVVEAPLRRRVARPGVGLAYVSDRAYRLSLGLRRVHRVGVTQAVVESVLAIPDPFDRSLAAAILTRRHAEDLRKVDARSLVGWASWLPAIDAVLNDRRIPFWGDIFEEVHPVDPVRDDLLEVFDPATPGSAVATQLLDGFGPQAEATVGDALLAGDSLWAAAEAAGVPFERLAQLRDRYPIDQDYRLDVDKAARRVTVTRIAPDDAPVETVLVIVDGQRRPMTFGRGPGIQELVLDGAPRTVVLDPDRHVHQTSQMGDRWPASYVATGAAWVNEVNLTEGFVNAFGAFSLRRRYDTYNGFSTSVTTNQETLLGLQVGYVRKAGPLLDGLQRPLRLSIWLGPSLLNPRFADVSNGRLALGAGVSWTWDNRVDYLFPLKGHRLRIAGDGGFVPGSENWWARATATATGLISFHPRHVLAGTASVGIARGEVDHRLLPLGGEAALRSIPPTLVISTRRGVLAAEYRWSLIRNASVPLGLLWGSDLQLSAGAELGAGWRDDKWVRAAGITAGASAVAHTLGADPFLIGVTLGWPVWDEGLDLERSWKPEVILRWDQAF